MAGLFQLLGCVLHCRACGGRALVPLFNMDAPVSIACPTCGARGLPDTPDEYRPAREVQRLPWSRRRRR
jgi:uncharacterized Zn finger protein (UPF0148 family)